MTLEQKNFCKEKLWDYVDSIADFTSNRKHCCPICNSGSGKNGTSAFSIKNSGDYFKCFSCGKSGDVFDLIAYVEGLNPGSREVFTRAKKLFLEDDDISLPIPANENKNQKENNMKGREMIQEVLDEPLTDDFLKYIGSCVYELNNTESIMKHLTQERGLSPETIDLYRLGVDFNFNIKNYDFSKADIGVTLGSSVIIPYPYVNYFTARLLTPHGSLKYYKLPGIREPLFNLCALYFETNDPVFIVEGQFDALSLIDVGVDAISLNGTAGKNRLVKTLETKMSHRPLILYLDSDAAGKKATTELCEELNKLDVIYFDANEYAGYKYNDPNEALVKDREWLSDIVYRSIERIASIPQERIREYIEENCVRTYLLEFIENIKSNRNKQGISTGFLYLDDILDGGLYPGLYVLGAISSLGKTTYCLQMADSIAAGGTDVLFFSLEMAKSEIVSKSLSRISYVLDNKQGLSTRQILNGNFAEPEKEHINKSIASYMELSGNLYLIEGMGDVTTATIEAAVEQHVRKTGNLPIVMMDYIQIIASSDKFANDKQIIDRAVFDMKRLSRKHSIPVLLISSFNRESYAKQVSMKSFKESGAIEYSSDVLMGIQISNVEKVDEKKVEGFINQQKSNETRKIELKMLKNRNGITGSSINYDYNPRYNYFKETGCEKHPKKMD